MGGGNLSPVSVTEVREAARRLATGGRERIRRTPLFRCDAPGLPAEVFLKLENLQKTGSFKARGAGNAVLKAAAEGAAKVWTASAGNMGLGVAWHARSLGLGSTVIVPADAPVSKKEALEVLGAEVVPLPRDEYWDVQKTHRREGMRGRFVHPFADMDVMAGNGTVALEVLEELPEADAILVPYGGGGLSCGIAAVMRCLKPETSVYAAETENGAPLAPSLSAGKMTEVPYTKSFVSGIGSPSVFEEMWPLAKELLAGSFVAKLDDIIHSMRILLRYNHVLVEGAGAVALAALLSGREGSMSESGFETLLNGKKIVCVITGGNIDFETVSELFRNQTKNKERDDGNR